jgi:hypothetical protein
MMLDLTEGDTEDTEEEEDTEEDTTDTEEDTTDTEEDTTDTTDTEALGKPRVRRRSRRKRSWRRRGRSGEC